jgi:uncharacterized membrane protein YfcA
MDAYVWLALLGVGLGAYGTLIGAGGGFILMPVLILLYPERKTSELTAISIAVVAVNALSGSLAYVRRRRIDFRSGIAFAAATIPGAVLGALATEHIPRTTFNAVFGGVMIAAAAFLVARRPMARPVGMAANGYELVEADGTRHTLSYNMWAGVGLSFFVGFVANILGIGGGIIHVPAMVQFLSFPVVIATATSQFILSITAVAGTAVHASTGTLEGVAGPTVAIAAGALVGAQIGARISGRVQPVWIIRGLAVALLIAGGRILWESFGRS